MGDYPKLDTSPNFRRDLLIRARLTVYIVMLIHAAQAFLPRFWGRYFYRYQIGSHDRLDSPSSADSDGPPFNRAQPTFDVSEAASMLSSPDRRGARLLIGNMGRTQRVVQFFHHEAQFR
jgi:hypothetical protein